MTKKRLEFDFFTRGACAVAQDLLGKRLVCVVDGIRAAGIIVESEAYCDSGSQDLACHASKNGGKPTPRTAVLFGPAGYSYVYLNYGIHWLFNVVTGVEGAPGAVLIRALEPTEGEINMAKRRSSHSRKNWTNGPAKLTKALAIDKSQNKKNLCAPNSVIWIEDAPSVPLASICTGPRIGLGKNTPEPWFSIPWRYWIDGNGFVSK